MSNSVDNNDLKVVAVTNQKGGVGKTTTTINLSAALIELGKKVLIIDLDPQGNASTGLGIDYDQRSLTVYDVLLAETSVSKAVLPTSMEGLHIIPSTVDLSSADIELIKTANHSTALSRALSEDRSLVDSYDFVFVDCPPSLSLLTINAMVAANSVLIPLQSEFFALEGLSQLMLSVREIRNSVNTELRFEGVVLTMFDRRNNLSQQVEKDARENLGEIVFKTVIPRNVRLSEAPSHSMPVITYEPRARGAQAYRRLAKEFLKNNRDISVSYTHLTLPTKRIV